ncbi:MAG: prepilin-type N-terminal cleavage/methylation domain-containing protein [Planctomycetota bacterium]
MIIHRDRVRRAFTLVELMVTILAAMILFAGISVMLVHGHLGYHRLFKRVNSQVVRNAYEARRTFDRAVRKSSIRRCDPMNADYEFLAEQNEAYVYYFSNPQDMTIEDPDRYARFYLEGSQLKLERGDVGLGTFDTPPPGLPSRSPTSTIILAHDVLAPESGIFSVQGASVRMVLLLDDETNAAAGVSKIQTLKMTVTTTAIRHNQ